MSVSDLSWKLSPTSSELKEKIGFTLKMDEQYIINALIW